MKKAFYLLLIILFSSLIVKAQTGWVTQKLDDKVSIKFPAAPQKITTNGMDIYVAKGTDSVGYIANFVDFKIVANLDSAALAPMKDTQQFADQLKTGLASTMGNYTLNEVILSKWKNYSTYSLTGTQNIEKDTLLIRMILIGTKLYSLSCVIPVNKTTKYNEVYFGSVEVGK